jgi:glycerate dehydrogenase
MKKIVVLDGFTLNPGDISWDPVKKFGELTVYDRTAFIPEKIIERIGNAGIVLTNKTPLHRAVLEKVPSLKYIGILATGYNVVELDATADYGIIVTNIPAYSTDAVAQYTFAMLLEMCHNVGAHDEAVKNGEWSASPDFCFWKFPLIELAGKTMGIIGFGRIGQATAKIAQAFGLKVLAYDLITDKSLESATCKYATLDELFSQSDIISLHCPLMEGTSGLIRKSTLGLMKDGVMIINTSRGPVINENDLCEALNRGKVAGAAVDVVSVEPISVDNPLLKARNCIITPHIAWASKESRTRLMKTAAENIGAFLEGKPVNVVSP